MRKSVKKLMTVITSSPQPFRLKLHNIFRKEPGNVIFSSVSLELVLVLAYMGARGKTAEEIVTAMGILQDIDLLKSAYNDIMTSLKDTEDMDLQIANKIYIDANFPIDKDFQTQVEKSFLAAVENIDFENNFETSQNAINTWVKEEIKSSITNLFSKGDITSQTIMVLINAVHFKGKWKTQFDPSHTVKQLFHISSSESKEVDMMHIRELFGYSKLEELKAKVLVMPFLGDKLCMMILLPDETEGLQEMENKLFSINIPELVKNVVQIKVEVSLPRFKIEKIMDLGKLLQILGLTSMFDEALANFSGISKVKGVCVSKIVQKAFFEVNEEGSEGAATTGATMTKCNIAHCEEFIADKPFLFVLLEVEKSVILFQGCYVGKD